MKKNKVWVEITTLMLPTLNDDADTIKKMCVWIKENVGAETPLHFSRFFPMYKLQNLPPTPVSTLEKAHAIAKEVGLLYVYIGNVPGQADAGTTWCPGCKRAILERDVFTVQRLEFTGGAWRFCGTTIAGVWS